MGQGGEDWDEVVGHGRRGIYNVLGLDLCNALEGRGEGGGFCF